MVRLLQGRADAETVYFHDPSAPARRWKAAGAEWVHVVDLDGAFDGASANREAVAGILETGMKVQLGGGMRSSEDVRRALDAGVSRVVIGTRAAIEPAFVGELVKQFGASRIAVGIDAKNGRVAIKGWVDTIEKDALDLAREVEEHGATTIIYTDISRDGMLIGPNFEAQKAMCDAVSCQIIASGGVAYASDITRFREMALSVSNLEGVITGKALYEGKIDLHAALQV